MTNILADLLDYVDDLIKSCENEEEFEKTGVNLIKYDDKFYNYLQEIYTNSFEANEIIKKIDTSKRTTEEHNTSVILVVFICIFSMLLENVNSIKFKDILENA